MSTLLKIMVTMPEELVREVDGLGGNRSEFIRECVRDRIKRSRKQLMIEGYSRETNLKEWEGTAGDGIES